MAQKNLVAIRNNSLKKCMQYEMVDISCNINGYLSGEKYVNMFKWSVVIIIVIKLSNIGKPSIKSMDMSF